MSMNHGGGLVLGDLLSMNFKQFKECDRVVYHLYYQICIHYNSVLPHPPFFVPTIGGNNFAADRNKHLHPVSIPNAFAMRVFPVPGGPNNRYFRCPNPLLVNSAGYFAGNIIPSLSLAITSSRPMMSSNLTEGLHQTTDFNSSGVFTRVLSILLFS
ncbi:hypothetical protein KUTeg_009798 [Tegillarca granosa]|uniref:Uncharacterized protein n=1 Tax=Tegillarca granosa TaxID=220873 RepID=A0ABQ9F4Y0_TEGGR|nr:hypothetical protein KUTeg_009798 [Tegillarca granosa]